MPIIITIPNDLNPDELVVLPADLTHVVSGSQTDDGITTVALIDLARHIVETYDDYGDDGDDDAYEAGFDTRPARPGQDPDMPHIPAEDDEEEWQGEGPMPEHDPRVKVEGARVRVPQEYATRWVGCTQEATVPAGATGTVEGYFYGCWDVHVLLDERNADGFEVHVWVSPDSLEIIEHADEDDECDPCRNVNVGDECHVCGRQRTMADLLPLD